MTDRLEDATERAFARHETFHPRYGWFRKGVLAAQRSPLLFLRDDAPVELGVGKNMVRAIRFWGRAAKVLADAPHPERPRAPLTVPSYNGLALFGDSGLDPYLEFPGSLWLLHWWLLAPVSLAPAWWLAFNRFGPLEFTDSDLCDFVQDEIDRSSWESGPAEGSIRKDVDCLLRMYAPRVEGRFALDDLLDCPFRELGLLEQVWDDRHRYRFVLGPKPTLPAAIAAYACLDYLASQGNGARTATVSRLAQAIGSPGRVFKLTPDALLQLLHDHSVHDVVSVVSAAGAPQLVVHEDPRNAATRLLAAYYTTMGVSFVDTVHLGPGPSVGPLWLSHLTTTTGEQTGLQPAVLEARP